MEMGYMIMESWGELFVSWNGTMDHFGLQGSSGLPSQTLCQQHLSHWRSAVSSNTNCLKTSSSIDSIPSQRLMPVRAAGVWEIPLRRDWCQQELMGV